MKNIIGILTAACITAPLHAMDTHAYWAEKTLNTLTLHQKIGQLFTVAVRADSYFDNPDTAVSANHQPQNVERMRPSHVKELIQKHHIGGVIYMGRHTSDEQLKLTRELQCCAQIPLLVVQDLEWGLNMRLTDCAPFPRAMTLGAIQDDKLIEKMGYEVGTQCKKLGVHINCAPVVDVNNNPNNPIIGMRSFGDNPNDVAHKAHAYSRGMQQAGIIPCIKHFPGHGDTHVDSHTDLPAITHKRKHLDNIELVPFKELIKKNIPALMVAHLHIPAFDSKPSSISRTLITNYLRNTLGYTGLVLSDGLDMRGITNHTPSPKVDLEALRAGNDMLVSSVHVVQAIQKIHQAVKDGTLSHDELDAHVLRILRAKHTIFNTYKHPSVLPQYTEPLYTNKTYALQKKLYAAAMTPLHTDTNKIIKPNVIVEVGEALSDAFSSELLCNSNTMCICAAEVADEITKNTPVALALYCAPAYKQVLPELTHKTITTLKKNGCTITNIILFGSPYLVTELPSAYPLLVAYENNEPAQYAAAQVIRGKARAPGMLPIMLHQRQ